MTSKLTTEISVRQLLFRWLLLPFILLLAIVAVAGYNVALYPATAAYDGALMDSALSLAHLLRAREDNTGLPLSQSADILLRTDQFDRIYYSVRDAHGNLVAGDAALAPPPGSFSSGERFYDSEIAGEQVRVAALAVDMPDSRFIVQVAETTVKRRRLVTQTLMGVISSDAIFAAVVFVLVWFGIGKGLRPLQQLRQEIEARSHRDLRPVPSARAPVEVQPMVNALNNLLARLEAALDAQRQFVANAAHQLRTPLAGLRMQVEYALQQKEPMEWRRVLVTLKVATERTAHLANQLLALAKAELGSHRFESTPSLDLQRVVENVTEEWIPRAIAKEIDLGLEVNSAQLNGDELLIGELLSNLLDNAITYTQRGGRVTVRVTTANGSAVLEVEDDGSGIPPEERDKVFRRFYRVNGSPGEGCGLGLAIVQEIAHLHGATVDIRTPPEAGQGTLVSVRFPLASPA